MIPARRLDASAELLRRGLVRGDVDDGTALARQPTLAVAALEVQQLTTAPALKALLTPMTWRKRAKLRRTSDFRIDNGRLQLVLNKPDTRHATPDTRHPAVACSKT